MVKVATRAGFTLVEMVVSVGLLALLSVGLVNSFFVTVKGGGRAQIQAEVKSQGDRIMGAMERSIRAATALPDCSVPGAITYSVRNAEGMIESKSYAYVASVENGSRDSIQETKDGVDMGKLSGGTVVVNDLTFTCTDSDGLSSGTVAIHLSLSIATTVDNPATQTFDTTVSIRNNK